MREHPGTSLFTSTSSGQSKGAHNAGGSPSGDRILKHRSVWFSLAVIKSLWRTAFRNYFQITESIYTLQQPSAVNPLHSELLQKKFKIGRVATVAIQHLLDCHRWLSCRVDWRLAFLHSLHYGYPEQKYLKYQITPKKGQQIQKNPKNS